MAKDASTHSETLLESRANFSQTHWTNLLRAQRGSPAANEALEKLCRKYWEPVYAFIRRKWKHSHHKAEDLTQGFFAQFLSRFPRMDLDPSKGKFRTYLLACLTNFLRKDWQRSKVDEFLIPPEELEQAAATDPTLGRESVTAEEAFDLVWVSTLVGKSLAALALEYQSTSKTALHENLVPYLTEKPGEGMYGTLSRELGMTEGALRVALHDLRRRFGELLRNEVAHTVPRLEDTEEELRYLLSLWGSQRVSDSPLRRL